MVSEMSRALLKLGFIECSVAILPADIALLGLVESTASKVKLKSTVCCNRDEVTRRSKR